MAQNEATKNSDPTRGNGRGAGAPASSRAVPSSSQPAPKKTGPLEFLAQVRDEGRKVTWPSRRETTITTIMVFIMVVVASIFFTIVDQILRWLVGLILGIGA